jgi:carboxyl-terminal processing protease
MRRPIRARSLALLVAILVGVGIGIGVERLRTARPAQPVTTAQVFEDVLAAIRDGYVDSLTDEELYAKAARGIVSSLGDPYSAFLGPAEYRRYRNLLEGRGRTIGIELSNGLAGLQVARIAPRGPAARLGVEVGDYLLAVDDTAIAGWSADRAAAMVAGPDSVRVRFRTPGDSAVVEGTLMPAESRLSAAGAPVRLTDSVAYLALASVSARASRDLGDRLKELRAERLAGLVLDLRGNGGGPLEEALAVADLFLAPGQRIGALELAILVDRKTASSAEIIAAALRDNRRARLVGQPTFGKGLVQTTIALGDSAGLRLTTGRWQGPGGRLIAGGILPDSIVELPPREALLRRVLGRHPEAVAQALDLIAAGLDSSRTSGPALDSLTLTPAERDRLRLLLRPAGITLSARMVARHRDLFDREVRRVAAVVRGDRSLALRHVLLGDPVIAAGLHLVDRRP